MNRRSPESWNMQEPMGNGPGSACSNVQVGSLGRQVMKVGKANARNGNVQHSNTKHMLGPGYRSPPKKGVKGNA